MIKLTLFTAAATLLASTAFADLERITSRNTLMQQVVGDRFNDIAQDAWFELRANGQIVGGFRGGDVAGTWEWSNGQVCFDRSLNGEPIGTSCVNIEVDGDSVRTIRGDGSSANYARGR